MSVTSAASRLDKKRFIAFAARIAALALFVVSTNDGFLQRVDLLLNQGRWVTLIGFFGVWLLSLVALLVAAFQRNIFLRCGLGFLIAFTAAAGFAYRHATGSELELFDGLSLWSARGEVSRASAFYASSVWWFIAIGISGFAVMVIPPVPKHEMLKRWLGRLFWMPAVPVVAIVAIMIVKEGGGAEVLPTQFAPLSVGMVVMSKATTVSIPKRKPITWTWSGPFAFPAPRTGSLPPTTRTARAPQIRHVVMLVDESIRGDYIDWTQGNAYTPELARLKDKIVNFGPASSGGNCSHYSNAILRFTAARDHLGRKLLTNPTIWQYAKKAGFRTTFIDAQAGFSRSPGKLQNFMTAQETQDIDNVEALDNTIAPTQLDDRLLDGVLAQIKSEKPTFIYANKNGAHFPYDYNYPASAREFSPTMSEVAVDSRLSRINSFRNAVKWSVDRFFKRVFDEADLSDTVIIYTSDHGQAFNPGQATHCTVENPDPRQGLVPLFVITGNDALRARFAAAAEATRGHASHFSIVPTVLELMGYDRGVVDGMFGESLLEKNTRQAAFTSGDIFGLFSDKVRWHPIDLTARYLEPEAESPKLSLQSAPSANVMR